MERTTPFPSRRCILAGAALTAVPSALLFATRADARPRAVDHPGAAWHPASRSNYTPSNRPRAHPLHYVIIHVAQTTYSGTVSVFRNPSRKVSAHYVVRSSDGHVAQCVRESDIAWHAGNWDYNTRSIGIEHEGWVDRPGYFTDAMYERSARLTAAICARYGIPRNRAHIIGHHEVPGSDHTDPGRHWDWNRYLRLVKSA
ncbi:N-acetylmuramoyl-L-alanine amidase [Streptomyces variegatus]|jgi:N-acetyl-anhydromuramyl-L-alanine amidase AmpD|uniref:N-acetylmuramoyl-L-alanine amidase n=1 Tax=Streptomyces variegatus TaxID=284040 RepID=UPI003C2AB427